MSQYDERSGQWTDFTREELANDWTGYTVNREELKEIIAELDRTVSGSPTGKTQEQLIPDTH